MRKNGTKQRNGKRKARKPGVRGRGGQRLPEGELGTRTCPRLPDFNEKVWIRGRVDRVKRNTDIAAGMKTLRISNQVRQWEIAEKLGLGSIAPWESGYVEWTPERIRLYRSAVASLSKTN